MSPPSKSRTEDTRQAASIAEITPERFSRYRRLLHFVAYRVLHNQREAEDAVQKCFMSISGKDLLFESEGSVRSWLARALIDEALVILRKRKIEPITISEGSWQDSAIGHRLGLENNAAQQVGPAEGNYFQHHRDRRIALAGVD
jgi:DNA-directed RNA polymerase specialized sigma24 family protein